MGSQEQSRGVLPAGEGQAHGSKSGLTVFGSNLRESCALRDVTRDSGLPQRSYCSDLFPILRLGLGQSLMNNKPTQMWRFSLPRFPDYREISLLSNT